MFKPTRRLARTQGTPEAGAPSADAPEWARQYGQELGRLYEPTTVLPPDLEQLVDALARRVAGP